MDYRLTDLDALLLSVRNPLSRSYADEAIKAYRAGSPKAAIVAIWVAVTYDIISKIRELADGGEQAATSFITLFDQNVAANNVQKLLQIENTLLETAESQFDFIDPISRRHFERLKEDRNLCAHPAFTSDGELFTPEPELVRLYLVEAVRNLLSQRPVQGRTVLTLFDRDFRGTAFPLESDAIPGYVESRYLANTKRSVLASFATVLAKALFRAPPAGWEPRLRLIPWALQAVKTHDQGIWAATVVPQLIRLIDDCEDVYLANAYAVLRLFPEILGGLPPAAADRLRAVVTNSEPEATDVRIFEAGEIAGFRETAAAKFAASARHIQVAALQRLPTQTYWDTAIARFRESGSYRGAENNFGGFITPFEPIATLDNMRDVFEVVRTNDQVSYASGIPEMLAAFVGAIASRYPLTLDHLQETLVLLEEQGRRRYFEEMLNVFRAAGVEPPAGEDEEE
jgi:hypothetical protein